MLADPPGALNISHTLTVHVYSLVVSKSFSEARLSRAKQPQQQKARAAPVTRVVRARVGLVRAVASEGRGGPGCTFSREMHFFCFAFSHPKWRHAAVY